MRLKLLLLVFLLALPLVVSATQVSQLPRPTSYVSDFAKVLSPQERASLEQIAVDLERNTTAELAIVTVPSLEGEDIAQYSIELADAWKVGKKGKDNGIILLLAPNERRVRIEVGYGLEGALPDVRASRIIRETMTPYLKADQWYDGLNAGAQAISLVVRGEATDGTSSPGETDTFGIQVFVLFWIALCSLFFGVTYYASGKAKPPAKYRKVLAYTYAGSAILALVLAFLGSMFAIMFALIAFGHIFALAFSMPQNGQGGGGWSSSWGSHGSSWSSGGSSGSFGGFGGGGFGGGGSSGSF